MTRDEAIELLRSGPAGVKIWNDLRDRGTKQPDLSGADLSNAKLHGADLSYANLYSANLHKTNLTNANLLRVNLRNANLVHAILRYAKVDRADLWGSNLSSAVLTRAHVHRANLSGTCLAEAVLDGADFWQADLSHANLSSTSLLKTYFSEASLDQVDLTHARCALSVFSFINLSTVKGLEYIKHHGPSTIGIDTIIKSRGKIPETFMRGCGVPDEFIQYIPSLVGSMSPVQFYSCFISYSHKDEEFCERLHSRMQQEGLRVWFAPEEMKGGRKIIDQIDSAIRFHDKLLLVLSEPSMKSEWVATEIYKARQREKKEGRQVLFPVRLCSFDAIRDWQSFDADSGKDMAREIREYFVPDFSNWKDHDSFEQAFARLLKDLRATEKPV